jgi:hypothetical protein
MKSTTTTLICDLCMNKVNGFYIVSNPFIKDKIRVDIYRVPIKQVDICENCHGKIINLLKENFPKSESLI